MKREIIPRRRERFASAGCLSHLNVSGITTLWRCVHFMYADDMDESRTAFALHSLAKIRTRRRSTDRLTG
jgi:hypothetical protein